MKNRYRLKVGAWASYTFFDEYKVARCLSVENSFSTSVAEFEILLPGKNEFIEIESEEEFDLSCI